MIQYGNHQNKTQFELLVLDYRMLLGSSVLKKSSVKT